MTENDRRSSLGVRRGGGAERRAPSAERLPPSADYIELHCHSAFSLLDGASHPEALVERARGLGYRALALTDHDDLGGAVSFSAAADSVGVEAIVGAELTVAIDDGRHGDERRGQGNRGRRVGEEGRSRLTHLVLLAEDRAGYGNLATLVTRARMDNPRGYPRVSLDTLARHAGGLFALTGCPRGWVPSRVAAGDLDGACEATATLLDIFERRVAVECWDHHLPEEREITRHLITIARALDIPWVVTNDVHYAWPEGRIVHDVLSCLRYESTLDAMGTRLRPNGEWYLKSPEQMWRRWQGNTAGIRATLEIAERCAFRLSELRPSLPAFPLPPGVTADEYLARLVEQGAWERWGIESRDAGLGTRDSAPPPPNPESRVPHPDLYLHQISYELEMISKLGLAGYFLIVWDIVRFARREGILCQGRGSAANSAVCFCLGITAVDPIKLNLLFERFLSEERQGAPDIDVDFAHQDREKVLQYVYERYGREHAAMVCEQITYRGRSAVRDAARVLGFSLEQADTLAAYSDRFSARATAEAMIAGETGGPTGRRADGQTGSGVAGPSPESRLPTPDSRLNQVKEAARRLTSADRPRPKASYEPYGSPSAQDSGSARQDWLDSNTPDGSRHTSRSPTSADRQQNDRPLPPHPAAHLPSGPSRSPLTAHAVQLLPSVSPSARRPVYMDPHAPDNHTERRNPTTALRPASAGMSVLERAGLDPTDRRVEVLPGIVEGLHQIPRHRSIHVGGFVLTQEPLFTVVPIEPAAMEGRTVVQWDKDDVEAAGLVKIDLLGLGMLTLLQNCLKYIRATRGHTIDLAALDMTDQAVYDDLCRADTIGIFQVESRAQMITLPRLKPRCFYDLVVEVALIRPGPIQGEMVHPYLRRRAGEESVTYPHPSLEPILKRTLGVPLFQEQGMQVAIAAAGFTPGEADNLRRAMGHKRSHERMAAVCEKLIAGMEKNGIPPETARRIYNQINAFADYGFPESHAASFALLVYASAYLKHYYAPEFTAAILNAQPMGFYSPGTLIEDARRHGVVVLPVDLTKSAWETTLEETGRRADGRTGSESGRGTRESGVGSRDAGRGIRESGVDGRNAGREVQDARRAAVGEAHAGEQSRTSRSDSRPSRPLPLTAHRSPLTPFDLPPASAPVVRLGLRLVRGLGPQARQKLERAIAEGGPFGWIADVVRRSGLDRRALRFLAEAGAFDSMVPDEPDARRRRAAIWRMLEEFRGDAGPLAPSCVRREVPAHVPAMTPLEITAADYRMTGVSLNGHPMRHLRELLRPNGVRTAREVLAMRDGERGVATAGLVICRQRPGTAKGFVFLTLEDETGMVNVVVTPQRFERQALLISRAPLLLVRGTLQVEGRVVNLRGEEFRELKARVGAEHARGHDFH